MKKINKIPLTILVVFLLLPKRLTFWLSLKVSTQSHLQFLFPTIHKWSYLVQCQLFWHISSFSWFSIWFLSLFPSFLLYLHNILWPKLYWSFLYTKKMKWKSHLIILNIFLLLKWFLKILFLNHQNLSLHILHCLL